MTGQTMRQIFLKAGIRFTEAAVLCNIDRSTLYHWFDGIEPKNRFLYTHAASVASRILKATHAGVLPLKEITGKERLPVIAEVLKKF